MPALVSANCWRSRRSISTMPSSSSSADTRLEMADCVMNSFSAARVMLLRVATQ